jgi:hypothetical protein
MDACALTPNPLAVARCSPHGRGGQHGGIAVDLMSWIGWGLLGLIVIGFCWDTSARIKRQCLVADPDSDVLIFVLYHGDHRYVWIFTPNRCNEVLRSAGRFASDADLNFTWWDAAQLSSKVREMCKETDR